MLTSHIRPRWNRSQGLLSTLEKKATNLICFVPLTSGAQRTTENITTVEDIFFFFFYLPPHPNPSLLCLFSRISHTSSALNDGLLLIKHDYLPENRCSSLSCPYLSNTPIVLHWKYVINTRVCVWVSWTVSRAARVKHLECVVFAWPIDLSAASPQQCVTLQSRMERFRSRLDVSDVSI